VSEAIPANERISIVRPVAEDIIHEFVEVVARLNHGYLSAIEGNSSIDVGAILSYQVLRTLGSGLGSAFLRLEFLFKFFFPPRRYCYDTRESAAEFSESLCGS